MPAVSAVAADDAQRELDAALPALDAAVASLKNLSKNDIVEVKSLQNPPDGVKIVMKAACIMFGEKPKMKDDPDNMGEHTATALAGCTHTCSQPDIGRANQLLFVLVHPARSAASGVDAGAEQ